MQPPSSAPSPRRLLPLKAGAHVAVAELRFPRAHARLAQGHLFGRFEPRLATSPSSTSEGARARDSPATATHASTSPTTRAAPLMLNCSQIMRATQERPQSRGREVGQLSSPLPTDACREPPATSAAVLVKTRERPKRSHRSVFTPPSRDMRIRVVCAQQKKKNVVARAVPPVEHDNKPLSQTCAGWARLRLPLPSGERKLSHKPACAINCRPGCASTDCSARAIPLAPSWHWLGREIGWPDSRGVPFAGSYPHDRFCGQPGSVWDERQGRPAPTRGSVAHWRSAGGKHCPQQQLARGHDAQPQPSAEV